MRELTVLKMGYTTAYCVEHFDKLVIIATETAEELTKYYYSKSGYWGYGAVLNLADLGMRRLLRFDDYDNLTIVRNVHTPYRFKDITGMAAALEKAIEGIALDCTEGYDDEFILDVLTFHTGVNPPSVVMFDPSTYPTNTKMVDVAPPENHKDAIQGFANKGEYLADVYLLSDPIWDVADELVRTYVDMLRGVK